VAFSKTGEIGEYYFEMVF